MNWTRPTEPVWRLSESWTCSDCRMTDAKETNNWRAIGEDMEFFCSTSICDPKPNYTRSGSTSDNIQPTYRWADISVSPETEIQLKSKDWTQLPLLTYLGCCIFAIWKSTSWTRFSLRRSQAGLSSWPIWKLSADLNRDERDSFDLVPLWSPPGLYLLTLKSVFQNFFQEVWCQERWEERTGESRETLSPHNIYFVVYNMFSVRCVERKL